VSISTTVSWPILIPTKGRAGTSSTIELVRGMDPTLFVEDGEWHAYHKAYPDLHIIEVGSVGAPGISRARNAALAFAGRFTPGWYWMLDDDLTGFYRASEESWSWVVHKSTPVSVLSLAQARVLADDTAALVGLGKQNYAWTTDKEVKPAANVIQAFAFHSARLRGVRFREELPYVEDAAFALECHLAGLTVLALPHLAYAAKRMGTVEGGCYDLYRNGKREEGMVRLAELFSKYVKTFRKDGVLDIRVNWVGARKAGALARVGVER